MSETERKLGGKIYDAIGKHSKNHYSDVHLQARQPLLIFARPGQRGSFTIDRLPERLPQSVYDVHLDGQYLGRFRYPAILEKFK